MQALQTPHFPLVDVTLPADEWSHDQLLKVINASKPSVTALVLGLIINLKL